MSLDIDWALLQPLLSPSSALLETLNSHLQSTPRPSFIGPIQITSLDFGSVSPEVTLKDIRDVWRAFDEGDDEGDEDVLRLREIQEAEERRNLRSGAAGAGRGQGEMSGLDDEAYDMVLSPLQSDFSPAGRSHGLEPHLEEPLGEEEDAAIEGGSVYSGWSPRQSVAAVGIGAGSIALGGPGLGSTSGGPRTPAPPGANGHRGQGGYSGQGGQRGHRPHPSTSNSIHGTLLDGGPGSGSRTGMGHSRQQSYYTAPQPPSHYSYAHSHSASQAHANAPAQDSYLHPDPNATYNQRFPSPSAATRHRYSPSPTPPITSSTPPPSPPARPGHLPASSSFDSHGGGTGGGHGIPSVQLHLNISHTSDLSITLLTSLQVNYPAPLFMSLPLKLSVTGLHLSADIIIAYSGAKHRLHLTIVPPPPDDPASPIKDHHRHIAGAEEVPIGQRLLPHLTIESEIGHADAHVLRNVGKVERFIADAVRKTLVEELVFPNFHTVAL